MKVLGIDTILHSACAAVIEDNKVLSNEIKSTSMSLANQSLLSLTRAHIGETEEVLREAIKKADIHIDDISLIAVNNSGSLLSNVLIGLVTANTLSTMLDIPIVDVNHQEGHIFSNWIERNPMDFHFPILVFSASGGHSLAALIKDILEFKIIYTSKGIRRNTKPYTEFRGIGFLFSQIVLMLDLAGARNEIMSDGEFIAQLAKRGNADEITLIPKKRKNCLSLESNLNILMGNVYKIIRKEKRWGRKLSDKFIVNIAASFESSLAKIIADYLYCLAQEYKAKEIHLVGGISANDVIREELIAKTLKRGIIARHPVKKSYCTDNAAMIANLGYYKFIQNPQKYIKRRYLDIKSDLVLEGVAMDQFAKKRIILD